MFLFNGDFRKLNLLGAEGTAGGGGTDGASATGGNVGNGAGDAAGNSTNGAAGGVSAAADWSKWKEALPEDLRKSGALEPIKTIEALAKGYENLSKTLGKEKFTIPDPKFATQDDYKAIFRKLGAPEKVEDFKFKLPDGVDEKSLDADFMANIKTAAVEAGVLPHQFEKIFESYHKVAASKVQAHQEQTKQMMQEQVNTLKQEWGGEFENQVKRANVAMMQLLPNEADRKAIIDSGLGSHPSIVKVLANAAKLLKEDAFIGFDAGVKNSMTPDEALAKARSIQGDWNHPYRNPTHPNHKTAKEEVTRLYQMAYPETKQN
jgi:hypothetical protein